MTTTTADPSGWRAWRLLGQRLVREPLVHFSILGALLFAGYALVHREPSARELAAAAGPRVLDVTVDDLETIRAGYRASWKREPDAAELADLMESFIGEEMLFREGSALGLDRDDVVVRRRIIEKMTALARPPAPPHEPTSDELRRWYQTYPHRFRQPARLSLQQIYFDPKRRRDPAGDARQALATLPPAADPPTGVGDELVLPTTLVDKSDIQVGHLYGEPFALAVMKAPIDRWSGPITSNFGQHLVKVTARTEARLPPFEEIEKYVRADWLTAETHGARAAALAIHDRYKVILSPEVRQAVGDAPALRPFVGR